MKKKKSRKTIITVLVFGLLFLAACSPRHSSHFQGSSKFRAPDKRMEWLKSEITDRLELNQSQKTRLDEIITDLIVSGKEMHTIRTSIRDVVMSGLRKNEISKENLIQGLFGLQVISYWQAFGLLILVQMVSFMFRYRRPEARRETATDCID